MELDVPDSDVPLFGVVSRLEEAKGADLVAAAAEPIVRSGAQLVVLGEGDGRIIRRLTEAAEALGGHMAVRSVYDEQLTHRIFAGSDFLLMPSRSEPFGPSQMHALRYGAIPIVHAVGGLADTITDLEAHESEGNGFHMSDVSEAALTEACRQAMELYRQPERRWAVAARGMTQDYSWERSANSYLELYARLLS